MKSIFPELKFIDENGCYTQLDKLYDELDEAWEAYHDKPILDFAMEVGDVATAAMTLLYIIENRTGITAESVMEMVRNKNEERGYGRKKVS